MEIIPKYAVVDYQYDKELGKITFSQCLGVFDNLTKAIGAAYLYISDLAFGLHGKAVCSELEEINGGSDLYIEYSYFDEQDSNRSYGYAVIYDNRDHLKEGQL